MISNEITFGATLKNHGYKIKENIGIGSYGAVYIVTKNDINYVLKQIPLPLNSTITQITSIKNEAKILSSLNSPYVVKYYESYEENNKLNIIMEYCEGGDLSHFMQNYKKTHYLMNENNNNNNNSFFLNEDFIWKVFIQISLGLYHIHAKKILHRDLKSLNIFLTKDFNVKIGDLGVAKILTNTNHARTFVGTPYYLSPEICEEKPYNEKGDVWALGCILYEMSTFRHPFEAKSQPALYLKIIKGVYDPLPARVGEEIKIMVHTLLEKNYFKRPNIKQVVSMNIFIEKAKKVGLIEKVLEVVNENKNKKKVIVMNKKINERVRSTMNMKVHNNNFGSKNNINISPKNSYNFLNNKNYYCSESELKNWNIKKKFLVENNNKYSKIKNTKIKQINIPKTPTKKRNINYNKSNTNISPKKNIFLTPIRCSRKFNNINNNINVNKIKNAKKNNNNFNNVNIDINEFMQKLKEKTKNSNFCVSDFINNSNNNNVIDETHITTTDVSTSNENNNIFNNNNNNKNINKNFIKNTSLNSNDLNYTDDDFSIDNNNNNNNNNDFDEFPSNSKFHINNVNNNNLIMTKQEKDEINSQQILYKKKYEYYLNELKKFSNLINIDKIFEIYNEKNDIEININKIEKYIEKKIPKDASKFLDIFIELLGYEIRYNNNNKILNENL